MGNNMLWLFKPPFRSNLVVISRHSGAIEWLREEFGIEGIPIISGNAIPEDVSGKWIIGNVPLALACHALNGIIFAIEFTGTPPRGQEFSANDMRAAGAHIVEYRVSLNKH